MEHMLRQQLSILLSRRQLRKRDKMSHLAEPIDDGEYNSVTTGAGQPHHKIHRDVGPRTTRNRQSLKKPRRGLSAVFMLVAGCTGLDVIPNIVIQGRPLKPLA